MWTLAWLVIPQPCKRKVLVFSILLSHCFMMIEFQDFSLLCWNIRGPINVVGRRHARELVKKHNPSMVILVETHCVFDRAERFWRKLGYDLGGFSDDIGQAGGIWILVANGRNFSMDVIDVFHQMVTVSIAKGNKKWICSAIYASPIPSVREALWDHMENLRAMLVDPWFLIGDFNEILLPSEVRGGNFLANRAVKFSQVLSNCNLIDLGAKGNLFTWYRNAEGHRPVSKRLDRALSNFEWRTQFPDAFVENLIRHHSDHSQLLLRCKDDNPPRSARPFRFQVAWLTHNDFSQVVHSAWTDGHLSIPAKLEKVCKEANDFNSRVFGNIFKRKRTLESRLKGIQRSLCYTDIRSLVLLEKDLHKDYDEVLKQEELIWLQKSREKWVKFGDKNTKFFMLKLLSGEGGTELMGYS